MRVLVTGASGFVGRAVCARLQSGGHDAIAAVRRAGSAPGFDERRIGDAGDDIDGATDWTAALAGIDAVIHLAARVHVMHEASGDPLADFRRVNTAGTRRLAEAAAQCGVRRLVFVSSIKVNGEGTTDLPFRADDAPAPQDPYGVSKHDAEQALAQVAARTGLEIVVVRPPLVYGPGVGGNLARLLRLVAAGAPLPFGALRNRRSLVGRGNLADALVTCVEHRAAAGRTFLAADGDDLSTPELCRRLGAALGQPARLFPVPLALLDLAGRATGRRAEIQRLCGSLVVDASGLRDQLGWRPPFAVDAELAETAAAWRRVRASTPA